eukprot:TRINITY_DN2968_c0_g1_i3.p3 TRINITY_DN2968_c0_g1~~TRINITY_DN2968_c0_g1_i3.p3  ORF type:complete len:100 (-),score=21.29 TRINITY_DN2968_c0_g1_i3:701-1000(-)
MCIRDRYQRRVRGNHNTAMTSHVLSPAPSVEDAELRVVRGQSGQYELGPTLGKGKFGKVKGGVNTVTGLRVAVKIIKKSLALEGGDSKEVAREVRCLQV